MNCPNCGAENEDDAYFCKNCGSIVATPMQDLSAQAGQSQAVPPPAPPMPPAQVPPMQGYPVQPPVGMPMQPVYYAPSMDGSCVAGMVLGIVSIALFWFPFIPWILGILALIFGAVGMKNIKGRQDTGNAMV